MAHDVHAMSAKPTQKKITDADVTGLKYFKKLRPLFDRLHAVGCDRDRAGNRTLHFDQYCCLVLLYMFNPVVSSLRAIQQASELKNVQRKLGCARASLGSLSESSHIFEPQLLEGIIADLGEQLMPIAQHVTGFCAKDCGEPKGDVMIQFGKGKVDFPGVFSELKKAGFNGPVMVESCELSDDIKILTANAKANREFLEKVFASL